MSIRLSVLGVLCAVIALHGTDVCAQALDRAELQQAKAELHEAKQELMRIAGEIKRLQQQRSETTDTLEQARNAVQATTDDVNRLSGEVKRARADVLLLCQNQDARQTRRCAHQNPDEFRRRNRRTVALLGEMNAAQAKLTEANTRVDELSSQIEQLAKDHVELKRSHEGAMSLIAALQPMIGNLEKVDVTRWRVGHWRKDKRWVNIGRLCVAFYTCAVKRGDEPGTANAQEASKIEISKPDEVQVRGTCTAGGKKVDDCPDCVTPAPTEVCQWRYAQ